LSYLYEVSGMDPEYIYAVLEIFMNNTPDNVVELDRLIRSTDDWDAIYKQAHFIKSSVSIVKVDNMFEDLATIEALARQQKGKNEITAIMDRIQAVFKEA